MAADKEQIKRKVAVLKTEVSAAKDENVQPKVNNHDAMVEQLANRLDKMLDDSDLLGDEVTDLKSELEQQEVS